MIVQFPLIMKTALQYLPHFFRGSNGPHAPANKLEKNLDLKLYLHNLRDLYTHASANDGQNFKFPLFCGKVPVGDKYPVEAHLYEGDKSRHIFSIISIKYPPYMMKSSCCYFF